MKIEKDIVKILKILKSHGQGYIVGGYIRDKLLGLNPKDCDFLTDIEYPKLLEIFKDFSPKEVGKHFGIIMIKFNGKHYEIAKMREDIGTPTDRKKQKVSYTQDISIDLKRRDFTINAIAYDGERFFSLEDSFSDIRNRNLRFIGDIKKRILEDPLRILRAFRFLSTKDLNRKFSLEIILENIELLNTLSIERIREEFHKIIMGKNLSVLKMMNEAGFFKGKSITDEFICEISAIEPDLEKRLMFFYLKLNYSLEEIKKFNYGKKFLNLFSNLKKCETNYRDNIYKILQILEKRNFEMFSNLLNPQERVILIKKYNNIIENNLPYRVQDLNINVDEMKKTFNLKGSEIPVVLEKLLDKIIENPKLNDEKNLKILLFEILQKS